MVVQHFLNIVNEKVQISIGEIQQQNVLHEQVDHLHFILTQSGQLNSNTCQSPFRRALSGLLLYEALLTAGYRPSIKYHSGTMKPFLVTV